MKTTIPKVSEIEQKWYVVDATDQSTGRLAVEVANLLRGKTKPTFTPHLDTGDFVVVINAEKVKLTGAKEEKKLYQRYTGYPSGLRKVTAKVVRAKDPRRIVVHAVKNMIPRNRLGRSQLKKLKVYAGPDHPHAAQKPEPLELAL